MANKHFGNLADVFKHVALAEALATMRPAEYWESHAGAATFTEAANGEPPPERRHGIHSFVRLTADFAALRGTSYHRILAQCQTGGNTATFPGSPRVASGLMGASVRRLLFCDTDAESLQSLTHMAPSSGTAAPREKTECVQDDGVSVLRGACLLLPEQWTATTLAFIDPYDIETPTDAGISPLELFCELANRTIVTILFYAFNDAAERTQRQQKISQALEKTRLLNHGVQKLEGSLVHAPASGEKSLTQWGFGLLIAGARPEMIEAMDVKLRALEAAYRTTELAPGISGQWRYTRAAI